MQKRSYQRRWIGTIESKLICATARVDTNRKEEKTKMRRQTPEILGEMMLRLYTPRPTEEVFVDPTEFRWHQRLHHITSHSKLVV